MGRIVVRLRADRARSGGLTLQDGRGRVVCGPFAVSGRASDVPAAAHNNPERSPLFRYGDTPVGLYRVVRILPSGPATSFDARQYGPNGVIVLDAVSGDAALAEANGRFHIFIQGGAIGRGGKLRSTNGCLRLFDADLKKLLERMRTLRPISCECIEEDASSESKRAVLVDDSYDEGDPPALLEGDPAASSFARRQYSRRKVIAVGAATVGSIAFGVVFFGRDGSVNWVAPGPAKAVAQDYGPPPQGLSGPSGPTNEQPSPEGSGGGAAGQAGKAKVQSETGAGAATEEESHRKASEPFDVNNPGCSVSGPAAVAVPPASEPPVPQDVSNPQYQQLKSDYDKNEQQYENAARAAQKAQSDWDNARRQPSSVSPDEYQAAQKRAQDAESARQWQEYQRNQAKQKITTFVLGQSPPPKNGGQ
jgi:hypothetical protein